MFPAPALPGMTANWPASAEPRQKGAAACPEAPATRIAAANPGTSVARTENTTGHVVPTTLRPVQSSIPGGTDENMGHSPPRGGGAHLCRARRADGGIAVER